MDGEKEQRSGNISKDLYAEQHEFIAQILGRTKCLGEQVETRYRQKYLVSVCFHTFLTNALIVYLERRTRVLWDNERGPEALRPSVLERQNGDRQDARQSFGDPQRQRAGSRRVVVERLQPLVQDVGGNGRHHARWLQIGPSADLVPAFHNPLPDHDPKELWEGRARFLQGVPASIQVEQLRVLWEPHFAGECQRAVRLVEQSRSRQVLEEQILGQVESAR